jgi:O-antigen ligase
MTKWADLLEKLLHIAMLSLIAGAVIPLWRGMSGRLIDPYEGDSLVRTLLFLGYVLVVFRVLLRLSWVKAIFLKGWPVWLFILWAVISFFWSTAPEVTFRRTVAVMLTTLYGFYLSYRYSVEEFLRILGYLFLVLLFGSLLVIIALPDWGIMSFPHEGAWRGVFVHKNVLGRFSALAGLVFALLMIRDRNVHWLAGLGLSVLLLMGSRSTTSLVLFGTMVFLLAYLGLEWRFRRFRRVWHFYFFILFSVGAMVLASNYEVILEALGKDVTLTGRVPLWLTLLPFVMDRLWTGYGLGGFWLGWEGPSGEVWSMVKWEAPHGHNGYLDLALDLGLPGLGLGLMLVVLVLLRAWKVYLSSGPTLKSATFLGIAMFEFIYNFAESTFLGVHNFFWLLLVWLFARRVNEEG